jgi:membrane-associated phospholipid phosphatase
MKTLPCGFVLCAAAFTGAAQNQADRSVLEVKPGQEALKNKDLYAKTGYFHPFVRMPKYALYDQKAIWTSPIHTAISDIKWWVIFGGLTGGLIAADKHIQKEAPSNNTLVRAGIDASYIGTSYTLIPIAAGFYFLGTATHSERFRETGLLSFETLIDTALVNLAVKSITDRARPLEGDRNGGFWSSTSPRWNSSFPSGHAINTFGMASVFAHEYHDKLWVKIVAYGYAAGVVGARLAANRHFPSDTVVGGALGWFIGDYVYGKRHNPGLDSKRTAAHKVMDHVHFGFAWN